MSKNSFKLNIGIFKKIRLKIIVFLLLIPLIIVISAQPRADVGSPSETIQTEHPCLLWQVQSENNTVYVLGSIHVANKEIYPLNKKIEEAFNKADILVVELNINETDPVEAKEKLMKIGLYSQGDTLEEHISKKTYALTQKKLEELELDISQFNNHKPWLLAMMIADLKLLSLGFDPNYGIDKYFLDQAEDGKRILELETFDFQINLFNGFSEYYQELMLLYTIMDLDKIEEELDKIIELWILGDVDSLEILLTKDLLEHPEVLPIYEELIYKRNIEMFSKIEQFLTTDKEYFIVIGAAHLIGTKSIIKMLENNNYFIKQL